MSREPQAIRDEILSLVREYHAASFGEEELFDPRTSEVRYAGRVFDQKELVNLVDSSLDFWLTSGRYCAALERALEAFLSVRYALLCNSGSSANLLAVSALTSPKLGERRLTPGDEVITVAAGFPTTLNPILQNGLVPVFLDIELETYNVDTSLLESSISPRTKAIILAHTLGNPFRVDEVKAFAERHNLWLIEDNCDALGATFDGRMTGSHGDLATLSFYPAHHITTGEGGCVLTSDPMLKTIVESFRDWGRDCWCAPGACDTCNRRFDWQLGRLPQGYDHKYIYSHIGYNLKMTEMQGAIGVAQVEKLPDFVASRRRNWSYLRQGLAELEEFFVLPRETAGGEASWFGFPLTVRENVPFSREELLVRLQDSRIATRLLFGGDLRLQPAYLDSSYRTIGDLPNTEVVLRNMFWLGVYPALSNTMLDHVIETIHTFISDRCGAAGSAGPRQALRQVSPARKLDPAPLS